MNISVCNFTKITYNFNQMWIEIKKIILVKSEIRKASQCSKLYQTDEFEIHLFTIHTFFFNLVRASLRII